MGPWGGLGTHRMPFGHSGDTITSGKRSSSYPSILQRRLTCFSRTFLMMLGGIVTMGTATTKRCIHARCNTRSSRLSSGHTLQIDWSL